MQSKFRQNSVKIQPKFSQISAKIQSKYCQNSSWSASRLQSFQSCFQKHLVALGLHKVNKHIKTCLTFSTKMTSKIPQRNVMSKLFKPNYVIQPEQKKGSSQKQEMSSKSHRLLLNNGLIQSAHTGAYVFLPLALRSITKLENLIDENLRQIDCQKISLPIMTDGNLWKKSGRWDLIQGELFKLKNRQDHDFVLGTIHKPRGYLA